VNVNISNIYSQLQKDVAHKHLNNVSSVRELFTFCFRS